MEFWDGYSTVGKKPIITRDPKELAGEAVREALEQGSINLSWRAKLWFHEWLLGLEELWILPQVAIIRL